MPERLKNNDSSVALLATDVSYSMIELEHKIRYYASVFSLFGITRLGIHLDNGAEWIACDLAAKNNHITCIPLPTFFSTHQIQNCCKSAGINGIISDSPDYIEKAIPGFTAEKTTMVETNLLVNKTNRDKLPLLTHNESGNNDVISKITFTSGTTGNPKGVLLTSSAINNVVDSLADVLVNTCMQRHLCLMPLSILLENIAGVYLSLKTGATIIAPPTRQLGIFGSSGVNSEMLCNAINQYQPNSLILLPQLLLELIRLAEHRKIHMDSLKFLAVGGGRVSPALIERAHKAGLPVYEGYGLSECCSVVSLNTPEHHKTGSVGKVLKHQQVHIESNEIVVTGNGFSGYLDTASSDQQQNIFSANKVIYSGDEGYLDNEGFLYINGRKKNIIVSSFGRNINPEWPESLLMESSFVRSAIILGEGKPFLSAIIVALPEHKSFIAQHIHSINEELPDYARIMDWHVLTPEQFARNNFMTANGRIRRDSIKAWADTNILDLNQVAI